MGKGFWVALATVVIVMIGAVWLFGDNANAPAANVDEPHAITAEDHTRGPEDAALTLIEYSDFQCPACGGAEPLIQQMLAEYPDDVRLVYRHFPLTQIHAQAYDAARASEAAGRQDRFWEMHDLLFERQQNWSGDAQARTTFESYAEELGLDLEQYESDFAAVNSRVDRDTAIAQQLGVNSTPTFYLNGEALEQNPTSIEVWREIIDSALAETSE
ncbi:MAG: thioredoxin domain-containing protein [Candidatus Saccharimonadales bacterium]